ncbi:MAG TPA: substrate-binding domain-containing protein [Candidatus Brocadiia bacterium]|nr:substrate-binding domain-containing protein [Candidatus Brocadiia bacterium]
MSSQASSVSFATESGGRLAQRIHAHFARRIRGGELAPGAKLPILRDVAQDFGVGLRTAARAYEQLQADGLVVSRKAVGTFVREEGERRPRPEIYLCVTQMYLSERASLSMTRIKGLLLQAERRGAVVHVIDSPAQFRPLRIAGHEPVAVVFYTERERAQAFGEVERYAEGKGWPACVAYGRTGGLFARAGAREPGFEMLASYLIGLGHKRIALINADPGPPGSASNARLGNRRGWLKGLSAAGLTPREEDYQEIAMDREADPARVEAALDRVLALRPRPTALMCVNDEVALAVLEMLARKGVRVPDDLSVTGYDGLPEGELSKPSLTTADQRLAEQGAAVADYVLDALAGRKPAPPAMPARLAARESTAPPGGGKSRRGHGASARQRRVRTVSSQQTKVEA